MFTRRSYLTWYEFKNGCNTHPHNFYIQFLSELGLLGFLCLITTYLFIMIKIFNFFRKKPDFDK